MSAVLSPVLPMLVDHCIDDIMHGYPELGADIAGRYGVGLRQGIEDALVRFLDLLGSDLPPLDEHLAESFASFGAREDRRGRTLATLLAAYRDGARRAWRVFSAAALANDVSKDALVALAEAIFVYIDELSSASALGFTQAQVARAAHRDLLRRELADAILAGEAGTGGPRVRELAGRVGWVIPARVAVAVLVQPSGQGPPPVVHPDILVSDRGHEVQGVIPAGSIRGLAKRFATTAGRGMRVYVGTVRPVAEAPLSLAHAQAVRQLADRGLADDGQVVLAARHLPALLLQADRRLLTGLVEAELAPLQDVAEQRRDVLAATLSAWLWHHGDRAATARELGVHPQTVSYRVGELRRLFGARLDDPARRFALLMALVGTRPRG